MAIRNADVIDRNLDESTKQTEGSEGAETSSHDEGKNLHVHGESLLGYIVGRLETQKRIEDVLWLFLRDDERQHFKAEMQRRIAAMSPFGKIFRALFQKEVNDVFHLGELIQLTSEEERIAAEARADAIELIEFKERLKVLLELCLYLSLILETLTSKQTRRSKEDKCIVHILLLRSGVESNPGPRTWIGDIDGCQKPSNDDLNHLSSCIGNGRRYLGESLCLSQAQLDHIEHDHKGMQNQIYHMLRKGTMPPLEASLKDILMIIDDASTKYGDMITVDWKGIALRFANIGQEQPTIQREAEDAVLARVADVENKIAALQNEVISLRAENEELKRAQKRNAEEGETSSEVKRLKQE